jgi:hypothetical protein
VLAPHQLRIIDAVAAAVLLVAVAAYLLLWLRGVLSLR